MLLLVILHKATEKGKNIVDPLQCCLINCPARPVGTRYGNAASYFEPGSQVHDWNILLGT
jgi:hypothetical protein